MLHRWLVGSAVIVASCAPRQITLRSSLDAQGTADLKTALARGASPDGDSTTNEPPICTAISLGRDDLVAVLVDAGADTNKQCGAGALWPFVYAGRSHRPQAMLKILAARGTTVILSALTRMATDTDGGDDAGVTTAFLNYIAKSFGPEDARVAADGPDQNARPICAAAYASDGPMITQLIQFGVDPNTMCPVPGVAGMPSNDEAPAVFLANFNGRLEGPSYRRAIAAFAAVGVVAKGATKNGVTAEELRKIDDDLRAEASAEQKRLDEESKRDHERLLQVQAEEERQWEQRRRESQEAGERWRQEHPGLTNPVEELEQRERERRAAAARQSASSNASDDGASSSAERTNADAPRGGKQGAQKGAREKAAAEKAAVEKPAAEQAEAEKQAREKERAEKLAAEKAEAERARQDYLRAMRDGIRLGAATCPGGDGAYFVHGTRPRMKGEFCIDVSYRASCPNDTSVSTGVADTFVGVNSCFGDTYRISPKPSCPVDRVTVRVTDVRPCD